MGSGAERGRRGERDENNIERHRNRKIVKGIKRYSKEVRSTFIGTLDKNKKKHCLINNPNAVLY